MFRPNYTLDKAVGAAMTAVGHGLSERVGIRCRIVLLPRSKREELERQITALAVAGGVLPASAVVGGVYTGPWIDGIKELLDWFIENWEVILEVILAIISIFMGQE